ncbi:ABC transporter permease [Oleiagrimonas soli]|uniref:ABC transporter ATP-binding protein n=1 Tax=Oleiagrimonas soli TaxID=1543381 RepID=A0A099CYC6_9GAMM|nr:ABC transporter permease [Oleiagrimonas soli]KGI78597.1 ABC transporter ATP-binding protein [Oleiagrimonas soli]MBB6184112.1 putative ABC transport system permease protein [Oleiagrimonas soli]
MFGYYLDLALRSLKRNWIMTALMVLAIGLGIGASMTMLTVLNVMTRDPLPGRSAHVYRPYLNPLPLSYHDEPGKVGGPTTGLTWPDAKALLEAHKGVRQAAMARGYLTARSDRSGVQPKSVGGSFTTRDFFTMFGVPFVAGRAWSEHDDTGAAPVVVLTKKLADRLFGTTSVVGRTAHLGGHDFQVVGVTENWQPQPLFYAMIGTDFDSGDQFFLPLSTAMSLQLSVNWGNGWGKDSSLTSPEVSWLAFWVELDTPAQVGAYQRFLVNYSAKQKELGRYERPASDARLYGLMQWLHREGLVPGDVMLQTWLALGFLFVCLVNIVALLLAKFLRKGGEISVRRALGARRRDVFRQLGVESALLGLGGGMLGIGLAELGLWAVRQRPNDYAHLAQMNGEMLVATVVLAILVSTLAGLLPAWRACRIAPALQLKAL